MIDLYKYGCLTTTCIRIMKDVTRTCTLRLSFYVNIKTISVRNKNAQTTVSQRLAYIAYSEIRYQDVIITFEFLR